MSRAWRWLDRGRPETLFVLAAGLFGLACAALTPPGQGPDEPAHWYRVWTLTRLEVVPVRRTAAGYAYGSRVPQSLERLGRRFAGLTADPRTRFHPGDLRDELRRPLDAGRTVYVTMDNTALYSPVGYVPATVFAAVAGAFGSPAVVLVYAARLGTLAGYLVIGWLAVRTTPVCKWPAVLALCSPMGLFLAGSVSADPMTTGLAFLGTALVLRAAVAPGRVTAAVAVAAAAAFAGVALCKSAYVPMACLSCGVRPSKWGGWPRAAGVPLAAAVAVGLWSGVTHPQGVRQRGGDPAVQMAWVVHHPVAYAAVFAGAVRRHGVDWVDESVGVLGWLDTPVWPPVVVGFYAALFWLTVAYGEPVSVGAGPRVGAAAAVVGCTWLVALASYLVWDAPAAAHLEGVQGRYFLPLLLGGCVVLHRRGGYAVRPAWMAVLLAAVGAFTVWTLARRYELPV